MKNDTSGEMEIYDRTYEDEAVMMGFWKQLHKALSKQ